MRLLDDDDEDWESDRDGVGSCDRWHTIALTTPIFLPISTVGVRMANSSKVQLLAWASDDIR